MEWERGIYRKVRKCNVTVIACHNLNNIEFATDDSADNGVVVPATDREEDIAKVMLWKSIELGWVVKTTT